MLRFIFTGLIFLAFTAQLAWAKPLKIESENIVLYGDVDEGAARDIVRELEIYRRTIFALVQKKPQPSETKLTIYSFDSSRPLAKYFGNKGTAGLYTTGTDGPIFFTSIKKSYRDDTFEEQVAKHEFSHHVLHKIVADDFPRWYDEGFANYLSTFKIEGDVISIGAPTIGHGGALERQRWMSPEDVLRSVRLYPWAKKGEGRSQLVNSFYAQSWLYVHYMQNNPEFGSALPDYLERLKRNADPLEAFEGAFGISVKDFHNRAKKYFGANAFPVVQFKAEAEFLAVDMVTYELSEAELDLEMLTGQSNILSEDNKKDYRKRLEAAREGLGDSERILMASAGLSVLEDEFDAAVAAAESLNASTPNKIEILRLLGDAYLGQSQMTRFQDLKETDLHHYESNADLQTALQHYGSVLKMNAKDDRTVRAVVRIYGRSNETLTDDARKAVQYYEGTIFQGKNPHAMLHLANIHLRDGKTVRGCDYLKAAKAQAKSEKSAYKSDLEARLSHLDGVYAGTCAG